MRRRIFIAVAAVVVLLGLSQLVLPWIAERRIRDRLGRHGHVVRVEVRAFPAVELLWHRADRVVVRLSSATGSQGDLASELVRTRDVDRLDASVDRLQILLLTLRRVRLHKAGPRLSGEATVTGADLRAALPQGFDVRPVATGNGELVLQGSATLFGRTLTLRARLVANEGKLYVEPDVVIGPLVSLRVFDDPRVAIDAVGARPAGGGGFTLTARGHLRG